jgi:hypothetical protein
MIVRARTGFNLAKYLRRRKKLDAEPTSAQIEMLIKESTNDNLRASTSRALSSALLSRQVPHLP